MKKILLSSLIVLGIAGAVIGATRAYFTDQETVSNTLSAGRLDVELRGAYANGIVIPVETGQTFAGGLFPGREFGPYEIAIYNKGYGQSTTPVKYAWTANYTGDSQALFDMLNVKVREGNCDWLTAPWFAGSGYIYQGPLKDMPAHLESVAGLLGVNITRCTWFYFELDTTADNTYQGLTTEFDLVLDATHDENPGWTE